uniref:Uncharacterized protein n=1 Tax=Rhizophora mucronata TaxID=61149 RepID=A0A2P2QWJ5_RHIMU
MTLACVTSCYRQLFRLWLTVACAYNNVIGMLAHILHPLL